MKNILFRFDINKKVGMGHFSRCTQLAKKFKEKEINVFFIIKENINLEKIIGSQFDYISISNKISEDDEIKITKQIILENKIGYFILDLPRSRSKVFFKEIKNICKIIVFDNLNKNNLESDMIVYPWDNLESFKNSLKIKDRKKIISGPQYMMLGNHDSYIKLKKNRRFKNRIFLSMGGSDKKNFTEVIIKKFKNSKINFEMIIVLGEFNSNKKKIENIIQSDTRFIIADKTKDIFELMRCSNIGIILFGITAYEAIFNELPSIVFSHSKLNDKYGKVLRDYNCAKYLGYYKEINFSDIPKISFELIQNNELRKKFIENGKKIIDGNATERIIEKIMSI